MKKRIQYSIRVMLLSTSYPGITPNNQIRSQKAQSHAAAKQVAKQSSPNRKLYRRLLRNQAYQYHFFMSKILKGNGN